MASPSNYQSMEQRPEQEENTPPAAASSSRRRSSPSASISSALSPPRSQHTHRRSTSSNSTLTPSPIRTSSATNPYDLHSDELILPSPPAESALMPSPMNLNDATPSPPLHSQIRMQGSPSFSSHQRGKSDDISTNSSSPEQQSASHHLKSAMKRTTLPAPPAGGSSMNRQPSAPHLVHWGGAGDGNEVSTNSSASHVTFSDGHESSFNSSSNLAQRISFSNASPSGFGPRGQSVPSVLPSLVLEGAPGAALPLPAPAAFDHLKQRPSTTMFGGGGGGVGASSQQLPDVSPSPLSRQISAGESSARELERALIEKRGKELKAHSVGLGRRQLYAMLNKNWLLKIRNPGQFLCEMLSPLLMVMVIVIGWIFSLPHVDNFPDERFANDTEIVQEVFEWVLDHIEPIPSYELNVDEEQLLDTRAPRSRYMHHREQERGYVYGQSREDALRQQYDEDHPIVHVEDLYATPVAFDTTPHFMSSLSPFSAFTRRGDLSSQFLSEKRQMQKKQQSLATPASQQYPHILSHHRDDSPSTNLTCFPISTLPGQQFCYDSSESTDMLSDILDFAGPMHIPDFDEFITTHTVLNYILYNSTQQATGESFQDLTSDIDKLDSVTNGRLANLIFLGKLIFTPDNPAVRELIDQLNHTHAQFNHVFTALSVDENAALSLSLDNVHTDQDRTWAILVFNQLNISEGILDYSIRMNSSVLPTTKSIVDQFQPGIDLDYKKYYYSGFLTLQAMIEQAVLERSVAGEGSSASSNPSPPHHTRGRRHHSSLTSTLSTPSDIPLNPNASTTQSIMGIPFPVLHYKGNSFYHSIGPLIGLVFCMSMLYPTSRLIKGIVEEKESKTKETMKMMGLKDWVFNGSWFITFFCQFIVTSTTLVLLLHFTLFPRTDPSLLFIFFLLFFLSEITLGFLITVFFSKAKLAGILGPILLFAATMPRYAFFSKDSISSMATDPSELTSKTIVSIMSPTAFTFGIDLIVQYEGANMSLGWSEFTSDTYSIGRVCAFLIIDFFLYAVLAWYLDHILPNEYGQRYGMLFCCRKKYWQDNVELDEEEEKEEENDKMDDAGKEEKKSSSASSSSYRPLIEPVAPSLHSKARVRVKSLRKQFTEGRGSQKRVFTAVHGLDLTMYEGQIIALLGHNGAGKSTSISMLTGLISPSSGDATIHGYSIRKNMKEIRKTLGCCPQQNVLHSKLSCYDHLKLYATLKGVKPEQLEAEVNKKLEEVGLMDKKHYYSSALSGGMQRRLQCAMALIGDSKVVFLDEPTSGMDPYSRRSTWEMLRNAKKNRVIVLTTHFMDEAEILSDRVAILSEGRLLCAGSSMFLKQAYGGAYVLTLMKANKKCRVEQVSKMVRFFVPQASVLSTAGGEMSYRLPWNAVKQFPGLFAQLEERRSLMGIGGYGISQTTLEEVFLRCAQINPSENGANGNGMKGKDIEDGEGHHPFAAVEEERRKRSESMSRSSRPGSRKTSSAMTRPQLEVSTASTTASNGEYSSIPSSTSPNPVSISVSGQNGDNNNDSPQPPSTGSYSPPPLHHRPTLRGQFLASFQKRYICAIRDWSGRFFEVVLPVLVVTLVLLILKLNKPEDGSNMLMKAELYSGGGIYSPFWYASQYASRLEPSTIYSFEYARGIAPDSPDAIYSMIPKNFSDSIQMTDALLDSYNQHTGHRYGALIFNDSIFTHFNYSTYIPNTTFVEHPHLTVMHNSSFFHCLPVLVAEVAQARWNANRWRIQLNQKNHYQRGTLSTTNSQPSYPPSQVTYELRNHPLPLTSSDSLRTRTYLTLFAALFILIPFCYLPASFVLFVVKERSTKSKHQQFVSGLNPHIYWVSTYVWDMIQYSLVAVSVMIVMLCYKNSQFTGNVESFSATFLLFLLYGFSSIPLAYCYSFCFGNYTSAQVGIAGLNFITGFVLVIASFMLDNIGTDTEHINEKLKHIYRIFPSFTLGEGLINLSTSDFFAMIHSQPKPSPFAWEVIGRSLTYLIGEAVTFFMFTLIFESSFTHRMIRYLFNLSGDLAADVDPTTAEHEDEDVARERRRVQKLRIRLLKHTKDGGLQYQGLSSPVTPGYGLKANSDASSEDTSNVVTPKQITKVSAPKPPRHTNVNPVSLTASDGRGPPEVITSPHRFSFDSKAEADMQRKSSSPQRVGSGNKKKNSVSPLRAPLLDSDDRLQVMEDDKLMSDSQRASKRSPIKLLTPPSAISTYRDDGSNGESALPSYPSSYNAHTSSSSSSAAPRDPSSSPNSVHPDHDVPEEEEDILVVQHLRKVYPARGNGKVTCAVENLSLGIPRGQVFGFLGINGAGKTTTMKMLTGDIPITKGRAYINGFSVVKQLDSVRKELGYCPQVDPLHELMTPRETLTMYARIHGLPTDEIAPTVKKLLDTLGLGKFADKVCGPFSGGNKRKLSLAIALIGDPSVVFLDEPSTGMDPVSRRFMWSVIAAESDHRSIILTTHSMEECEALCSRIGIMVSGSLQCLGAVQHLKSRFGQDYQVDINGQESRVKDIHAFVSKQYPTSKLDEEHAGRIKYRLPQSGISLSSVFSMMESQKKSLGIYDYAISQCSLESIFINRVKEQKGENQPSGSP